MIITIFYNSYPYYFALFLFSLSILLLFIIMIIIFYYLYDYYIIIIVIIIFTLRPLQPKAHGVLVVPQMGLARPPLCCLRCVLPLSGWALGVLAYPLPRCAL